MIYFLRLRTVVPCVSTKASPYLVCKNHSPSTAHKKKKMAKNRKAKYPTPERLRKGRSNWIGFLLVNRGVRINQASKRVMPRVSVSVCVASKAKQSKAEPEASASLQVSKRRKMLALGCLSLFQLFFKSCPSTTNYIREKPFGFCVFAFFSMVRQYKPHHSTPYRTIPR